MLYEYRCGSVFPLPCPYPPDSRVFVVVAQFIFSSQRAPSAGEKRLKMLN